MKNKYICHQMHTEAVQVVQEVLTSLGHSVHLMPLACCKFDVLMDGLLRIEVKTANMYERPYITTKGPAASVNFHRGGRVVQEDDADLFWVVFLPKKDSLLFSSQFIEGKYTMHFSQRGIAKKYQKQINNYDLINPALDDRKEQLISKGGSLLSKLQRTITSNDYREIVRWTEHMSRFGELTSKMYSSGHRKKKTWAVLG